MLCGAIDPRALSDAQLETLVDRNMTFAELGTKYEINLFCPYCNQTVRNDPPDPKFDAHRITDVCRPKCGKCKKPLIVLLQPDPRIDPLLAPPSRPKPE